MIKPGRQDSLAPQPPGAARENQEDRPRNFLGVKRALRPPHCHRVNKGQIPFDQQTEARGVCPAFAKLKAFPIRWNDWRDGAHGIGDTSLDSTP